jgi:hypothetical protein
VIGHCGGVGPLQNERREAHRVGARGLGALTTLKTSAHTDRRKKMVINLDRLTPYEETAWDEALRRE